MVVFVNPVSIQRQGLERVPYPKIASRRFIFKLTCKLSPRLLNKPPEDSLSTGGFLLNSGHPKIKPLLYSDLERAVFNALRKGLHKRLIHS